MSPDSQTIQISSPAFTAGQPIPAEFTCQGANRSPELKWNGVPTGARSLALLVEDPDAPSGTFTHWVLANISPTTSGLEAGMPTDANVLSGAIQGTNGGGRTGYMGPCPPAGKPHHYIFTLYAVDQVLNLNGTPSKAAVLAALKGHILATGQLIGTFQR